MNKLYTTILHILLLIGSTKTTSAQGNNFIVVSGTVLGQDDKLPLPGVTVTIKNTVSGTSTNSEGKFEIRTRAKFPFTLVISSVGFQTQEFLIENADSKLNIELVTQTQLGREVVVTASRVEESILKSPVAIEKLDIRAIRESPAPSFYDALENVKGLNALQKIGGYLQVTNNAKLVDLKGFNAVQSIGNYIYIINNNALENLMSANALKSVNGKIEIRLNPTLKSLSGFDKLDEKTIKNLILSNNASLAFCNSEVICKYLANPSNIATIANNAANCNSKEAIVSLCATK
jgi:hypothetical protein